MTDKKSLLEGRKFKNILDTHIHPLLALVCMVVYILKSSNVLDNQNLISDSKGEERVNLWTTNDDDSWLVWEAQNLSSLNSSLFIRKLKKNAHNVTHILRLFVSSTVDGSFLFIELLPYNIM